MTNFHTPFNLCLALLLSLIFSKKNLELSSSQHTLLPNPTDTSLIFEEESAFRKKKLDHETKLLKLEFKMQGYEYQADYIWFLDDQYNLIYAEHSQSGEGRYAHETFYFKKNPSKLLLCVLIDGFEDSEEWEIHHHSLGVLRYSLSNDMPIEWLGESLNKTESLTDRNHKILGILEQQKKLFKEAAVNDIWSFEREGTQFDLTLSDELIPYIMK